MEAKPVRLGKVTHILIWALILLGLYLSSRYSYLLFHSLAEMFSVVIAVGVFAIAWNSRRFMENNYLIFLGIAYLFVGALDLVHALAYKGMGVFPGFGANLPTQLWISARGLEAVSLLLAPWFFHRRFLAGAVFGAYSLVFALLLLAIFTGLFPVCYVEGVGLTAFKISSEYLICLILAAALASLWRVREEFDRAVLRLIIWSIVLTIASELAFTYYVGVYDLSNLVGHMLKILSFYLIYKALIETGLVRPYNLLFRNLKQSEEALRLVNRELELKVQEVNERRAELEAVNQELESFSYLVSHDLRSPLRSIRGFCRILEEDFGGSLDPQALDHLHMVKDSARQMEELIDALLTLSRLRQAPMRRIRTDLSALARDIAGNLQRSGPGRRVEFIIEPGLHIHGDPAMLRALLANLLGNAWKFTGKVPQARIEFGALSREGGDRVFFVRDNGAGFEVGYVHKLFGPFQRLHSTREFPGSGIGLATVQRIVARHGGKVWAEGAPDQGAIFYFTLEDQGEDDIS
jgi:signal transduction histidine kinase